MPHAVRTMRFATKALTSSLLVWGLDHPVPGLEVSVSMILYADLSVVLL